jgi:hypothetical protein
MFLFTHPITCAASISSQGVGKTLGGGASTDHGPAEDLVIQVPTAASSSIALQPFHSTHLRYFYCLLPDCPLILITAQIVKAFGSRKCSQNVTKAQVLFINT